MPEKLDYKKEYKNLYMPGKRPAVIQVPPMVFAAVDGCGAPESPCYQNAVSVLYSLAYTIKFSKMSGSAPQGYFEYVMPPLEGLWESGAAGNLSQRTDWRWSAMIRQPEFVTPDAFAQFVEEAAAKKPELDFSVLRLWQWEEGLCAQAMHHGPYAEEPATVQKIHQFIEETGYALDQDDTLRRHHEIYLSSPTRTAPQNLRTVLRLPIRKA